MSDEQTIYISPDDDLTTVRERLEEIPARRVMLVIPSQTQLRSHVAWKLLYASMRELGKDVLIVSSDPQIRSVAHAVKFNVAHSLESSQVNRTTRTPSHPTRTTPTSRRATNSMLRPGPNPGRAASSATPDVERPVRKQTAPMQRPAPAPIPFEQARAQAKQEQPRNDFLDDDAQRERDIPTQRSRYGQSYDFNVKRPSQILPLQQEQIDEEPDLLIEDYEQSQNIRQAASAGQQANSEKLKAVKAQDAPAFIDDDGRPAEQLGAARSGPLQEDPFDSLTDTQASPTAEQHGGVSFAGSETQEHIIQDAPEVQAPFLMSQRVVPEPAPGTRPAQPPASRSLGNANSPTSRRPPTNRDASQRPRNSVSLRSQPLSYQDEDALPPPINNQSFANQAPKRSSKALQPEARVENRNDIYTRGTARVQSAPSPASTAARQQRISRNLVPPATPVPATRLSGHLPASAKPRQKTQGLRPAPPPGQLASAQRNKRRGSWLAFLVIALVIVLLALAAFVPTANVTIIVQSRDYAHAVSVIAHPTATSNQANAVVAHQYAHTFQATGQGNATGTKTVNKARATGSVCFINNGGNSVEIPTGSVVATGQNGTQFSTTADVVISAHSTCASSPPDPVQAVSAGESGNVAAGVVTTIPTSSLSAIAQYNKTSVSNLNLTVNNPAAIGGGGMQPFPAVTTADRTNVQKTLHQQLQGDVTTWLKSLPQNGVAGKPFTTDTLINTPAADTVINSGNTFSATIQENVTVLFVSTLDLQKAATTQLNSIIHSDKTYAGYDIIQDAFAQVKIVQVKQQDPDASTLSISYNATAKAAPAIPLSTVQDEAKGKSIGNARAELMQNLGSRGVQQVNIVVTPAFIPWVTPLTGHISVHEQPTTTPVTSPAK